MLKGFQEYHLKLSGEKSLEFSGFDMTWSEYPEVDNIEITSVDEWSIRVKTSFANIDSKAHADSIAKHVANRIAERIAFQFIVSIGEPLAGEASFETVVTNASNASANSQFISHSAHLTGAIRGHVKYPVPSPELSTLKGLITTPNSNKDTHYLTFRWILCQNDAVARFMHLYQLLLFLEGGPQQTQRTVEAFIQREEPSVMLSSDPRDPTGQRQETVYTKLRNELGHVRIGATPQNTRQEMENNLLGLTNLVKRAIDNIP